MNWFTKFWHELRNPHCEHCSDERERARNIKAEEEACDSCHMLRLENARLINENGRLLDRILNPIREEVIEKPASPIEMPKKHLPWRVRQQILEQEDRQAARARNEAAKPSKPSGPQTVQELEKELGVEDATGN